jgi:arylsulfatase A-like enzyme
MVEMLEEWDWPTGNIDTTGMSEAEATRTAYQRYLKDYLRTIMAIDENVGRLLDFLDRAGIADETLVVYTSDQGMFLGEHDYIDKRWFFEESARMPFLARYPAEIPRDSFVDDLVANIDFAPTFLDYAGVERSDSMDGRSIRDVLNGDTPGEWRDSVYYRYWMHETHHDVPAHYGLRTARYKLVFYYALPLDAAGATDEPTEPGWELYDLKRDPHELRNVYDDPSYERVRERLITKLDERKRELGDTDEQYPELVARRDETR